MAKVSREQCSLSQPQSINGQLTIEHYQLTINTLADSLSALRPCPQLLLVFGFDASSVGPHQRQHEELA